MSDRESPLITILTGTHSAPEGGDLISMILMMTWAGGLLVGPVAVCHSVWMFRILSNVCLVEADPELVPHDLRERERAVRAGRDISVPVGVTHFFSLADAPGDRPAGAEEALRAAGIDDLVVDEELGGDGYWHIAAFTMLLLEPPAIRSAEQQMAQLATDNGCVYDGWHVTLTAGWEPPSEPQASGSGTP